MKKIASITAAVLLGFGGTAAAQSLPTNFLPQGTVLDAVVGGTVEGLVGTLGALQSGTLALNPTLNGTVGSGATVQGAVAGPLNATLSGLLATDPGRSLPRVLTNPAAVPQTVAALGVTLGTTVTSLTRALAGDQAAQFAALFKTSYAKIANSLLAKSAPLFAAAQPLYDAFSAPLPGLGQSGGSSALPGLGGGNPLGGLASQ